MKEFKYLGTDGDEIYFEIETRGVNNIESIGIVGLRPETEEALRRQARDSDIKDFYRIDPELERYIDFNKFAEDMEENWENHHDVSLRYIKDGVTYYCGFGSSSWGLSSIKEYNFNSFKEFKVPFSEIGITKKQFEQLRDAILLYNLQDNKEDYSNVIKVVRTFKDLPKGCVPE
jgi:hypothetical protein